MIHQPATSLYEGQAGECMLEANELLKMRKTMTNIYAQRTGKASWQIYKDMERDLFMSAEEAQAHGIVDTVADFQMTVDILLRIRLGPRQVLYERVCFRPAPIVGPQVDVGIVNVLIGGNAFPTTEVILTAPCALRTDADQVVGIEFTDEG